MHVLACDCYPRRWTVSVCASSNTLPVHTMHTAQECIRLAYSIVSEELSGHQHDGERFAAAPMRVLAWHVRGLMHALLQDKLHVVLERPGCANLCD